MIYANLFAALALTTSIVVAHEVGWSRATKAVSAAAIAREKGIQADHDNALGKANQRERDAETRARDVVDVQAATYQKEIENERKMRLRFESDVRSGAVRMSIPIIRDSAHCAASAGTDAALAAGDRAETRAELGPQTGLDLAAIAHDGDDAIRQLNTCIDTYNTVRARYNALDHAQTPKPARTN